MRTDAGLSKASLVRLATVGLIVFAQGIPHMFITNALPVIYRTIGMDLSDFWIFSLPLIPRWVKWLIGPYVDSKTLLPIGLRRSWILVCTIAGAAAYTALAWTHPTIENVYLVVFVLFWAELVMAVQDVSVDAYCVEVLDGKESKLSGSLLGIAHMLSFAVASGVVMVVYQYFGWMPAVFSMSALLVLCTLPALLQPEPIGDAQRAASIQAKGRPNFRRAFTRENALLLLGLVAIAAVYASFTYALFSTMLVDKGLSVAQIGIASGVGVTIAGILGALITGWLLLRLSLKQMCLIACVPLVLAHSLEIWVSLSATISLTTAMIIFFLFDLAVAPHFALMSAARIRWTTKRQAGTDYTIQSSLRAVGLFIGGAAAGPAADAIGWTLFFWCGMLLGLGATLFMYVIHDKLEKTIARERAEDDQALEQDESRPVIRPDGAAPHGSTAMPSEA